MCGKIERAACCGREYGVDLDAEPQASLKDLLKLEREGTRAEQEDVCGTILKAGQSTLRKEFEPASRRRTGQDTYTLKQLRSDIVLVRFV